MNATLEIIARRKSLRAYSDRTLTREEKDTILHAAFRAPTAGNMMLYSIIEIEDQVLKERLAETCDHQPFIARAPYVLLFLADYQRWYDAFIEFGVPQRCQALGQEMRRPQEGDLMLACCDALIAAQNAVIAAEALGMGSCYIGDILENWEIHHQLLALPEYTLPVTMLCFGYPAAERASNRQARRFEGEYIVHRNTYRRLEPVQLRAMMQPLEEHFSLSPAAVHQPENAVQAMYFRKFSSAFSVEMNRSVREMLKNWQPSE